MGMTSPQLVSIGYEGRSADQLIKDLIARGVEVLVDVRLTPLSRKPGLSKTKLAARLRESGIDYVHLKALGNPKHNRQPFWEGRTVDGCKFFDALLADPEPQSALAMIAELSANATVGVLCFERDHARCHRQVVTSRVRDLLDVDQNETPRVVYA